MSLSLSCATTKPSLKFHSCLKYQQQRPNTSVTFVRCDSKDSSEENELLEKRSKLNKGSPVIIIEAPKMIKTAASLPCLRVNSGLVKPGDVGRYFTSSLTFFSSFRLSESSQIFESLSLKN